jgi:hypothetical protein
MTQAEALEEIEKAYREFENKLEFQRGRVRNVLANALTRLGKSVLTTDVNQKDL